MGIEKRQVCLRHTLTNQIPVKMLKASSRRIPRASLLVNHPSTLEWEKSAFPFHRGWEWSRNLLLFSFYDLESPQQPQDGHLRFPWGQQEAFPGEILALWTDLQEPLPA